MLGGSELQCDLIADGLAKLGHNVYYLAVGKNNEKYENYSKFLYEILPFDVFSKDETFILLERIKPDIVYWRYNKYNLHSFTLVCQKLMIPIIFAISAVSDTHHFPSRDRIFIALKNKNIIKSIYGILGLINYHNNAKPAFKYINGVTTNNSDYIGLLPVKKQITIWNAAFPVVGSFSWQKPYCLWVSNIKPKKRPELFISLARKMSDIIPELDFIMIGSVQDPICKKLIDGASQLPNFHYIGPKSPDVVNIALSNAHCMVHTCQREGFPNNIIQAWAMKCPTISYDFDPDNLIVGKSLGFVSGSLVKMAEQVEILWENTQLRSEISERALKFVSTNMTQDVMCRKLESFFTEVIKEYKDGHCY